MGWTSLTTTQATAKEAIIYEVTRYFSTGDWEVIDYAYQGGKYKGELYMAYKNTRLKLIIGQVVIVELDQHSSELSYKEIMEVAGPCYYRCPAKIIDQLSSLDQLKKYEIETTYAQNWREKCAGSKKTTCEQTNLFYEQTKLF